MNVFMLDADMRKSAEMLDDAHLLAQINESCQIMTANYNKEHYPDAKIGHVNQTVVKYYAREQEKQELYTYLGFLLEEYKFRFKKQHQNVFWYCGFWVSGFSNCSCWPSQNVFKCSKTLVDDKVLTNDISTIRDYIMNKEHKHVLKWTGRTKPEWWTKE